MLLPKGEELRPTRTIRRLEAATIRKPGHIPDPGLLQPRELTPGLQQKVPLLRV